jgi:hypothetical protein
MKGSIMSQSKMTRSEAGKLGGSKGGQITREKWKEHYLANQKFCKFCNKPIPYEKRTLSFCDHSCSASFNNIGIRRNGEDPGNCLGCGVKLISSKRTYCQKCNKEHIYKTWIEDWKGGKYTGLKKGVYYAVSKKIRRWLKEEQNGKCKICGISEWLGKPVPMVLDHIDGDALNNKPDNLRFVCRNCDGLLPTFCGKNIGRGKRKYTISYKQ